MRMRFSKRIYFTIVTSITISGFIVICTLGQSIHREKAEAKAAAAEERIREPLYTVREYNGRIGIFCRGNSEPFRYAELSPSLLPEFDRRQLADGIGFDTEEELRIYLEDIE